MKKLGMLFLINILVILSLSNFNVEAASNEVTAEKLWSVTMNMVPLNTPENLKKIIILNEEGRSVPVNIQVNDENNKVIEVISKEAYSFGKYKLIIPTDFEAENGLKTSSNVEQEFVVNSKLTTNSLEGTWTTNYSYQGSLLKITVAFFNGQANIRVIKNGIEYSGIEGYTIENGRMKMNIEDLGINLDGKINIYTLRKFKIITNGNNYSYFERIN